MPIFIFVSFEYFNIDIFVFSCDIVMCERGVEIGKTIDNQMVANERSTDMHCI